MAHHYAGMAELADAPDLGSGGFIRGGSNPLARTIRVMYTSVYAEVLFYRKLNIFCLCICHGFDYKREGILHESIY
jgi:hypothetical protein